MSSKIKKIHRPREFWRNLNQALNLAKGKTNESRSLDVLNGSLKPSWLIRAEVASPEEDEYYGIDIKLHLIDGETIVPVQIKSSPQGLLNHVQKRRSKKSRFVVVVIVNDRLTDTQIIEAFREAVLFYGKGKQRFIARNKRAEKKRIKEEKSREKRKTSQKIT